MVVFQVVVGFLCICPKLCHSCIVVQRIHCIQGTAFLQITPRLLSLMYIAKMFGSVDSNRTEHLRFENTIALL